MVFLTDVTDVGRVVLNGTKLYPAVGSYLEYAAMDAAGILATAFSPPPTGVLHALFAVLFL